MGNCKQTALDIAEDVGDIILTPEIQNALLEHIREMMKETVDIIVPETVENSVRATMDKVKIQDSLRTPSSIQILGDMVIIDAPIPEQLDLNSLKHFRFQSSLTGEKVDLETRAFSFPDEAD